MEKKTALYEEHLALGGKIVDFGGWALPIQYTQLIEEHLACRSQAGLFDVSHMGEVHVEGRQAAPFLDYLLTNDIENLDIGQAQYNLMCNSSGGTVDDLVVYRRGEEAFLLVVNAANSEKDFKHMKQTQISSDFKEVELSDCSLQYTQIAIQGPSASQILQKLTSEDLSQVGTYRFTEGKFLDGTPGIFARTGYTGEDGFEIYFEWAKGPEIWRALLKEGEANGIKPVGLGARDTLRLEMKYPLYGHELTEEIGPIEAGLKWAVQLKKKDFLGKEGLEKKIESRPTKKIAGLIMEERGIPRQGYSVFSEDSKEIGTITSGTHSPSLSQPIGIAWIEREQATVGNIVFVDIRGRKVRAKVVKTPFYQRKK